MNSQLTVKLIKNTKLPNDAAKFTLFGNQEKYFETNGRILSDSRFSWLSVGPQVTVINNQNGSKKNIWRVNNVMKDNITQVTCVSEIPPEWPGGDSLLAIACDEGTLYIYHSGASRILRTVHFSENVVSIEVVDMGIRRNSMLPEELQLMNGVLAVGLCGGAVYLIDLCRNLLERCLQEGSTPRNEIASQLMEIDLHNDCEAEIRAKKSRALHCGDTLALLLNESALALPRTFTLQSRAGSTVSRVPREQVSVTCLKYFKEVSCLAVGFNLSCFQLWHLPSFTLLYVSPLMEVVLPVVDFCLQEPCDDPRNVCYIWSVHQSIGENLTLPFAAMYMLNFDKKRYIRDYGSYYEEYRSCTLRYELDLGEDIPSAKDGRIISCYSVSKALPRRLPHYFIDQEVEESIISVCAIAWEVWTPERYDITTKLTLFDLNQWYKAQMPNNSMDDNTSYMTTLSLGSVNQIGAILDVRISPSTVRQFITMQPLDEHFFPSSLTFDCTCLTEKEIYKFTWHGIQNESLSMLDSSGPSALLTPTRIFHNFLNVGLRPSFYDVQDFTSISTDTERQVLLYIMLEHGYVNFLKDCVRSWADGSHSVANCTLPALVRWGWSAIFLYKQMTDHLCVQLFDYSGNKPDIKELTYCIRLLHTLSDLFTYILKHYRNFVLEDTLETQNRSLSLAILYLDSVLWFVENKILPEMHVETSLLKGIPYNLQSLKVKVNSRRTELTKLSKLLSDVPEGGIYLIDALISNEANGECIINEWEREGGGLYPPPSVQSMLRINLINGIPVYVKHCITLYFLMDLIDELPKKRQNADDVKDIISRFSTVFRLSASCVNIVKGLWCIDNKNFEEGLKYLFDSHVYKSDITQWQHRVVLRSLFIQQEHHLALKYIQKMTPPLCEPEDIKFELTLLLECELFLQAFEFQRRHKSLQSELLNSFFLGCLGKKQLGIVYKLSLNRSEEEAFTSFLESTQHQHSEDLRVLYLLSRARYVEAIDVNDKLRLKRTQNNAAIVSSPTKSSAINPRNFITRFKEESHANIRDVIVSGFAKTLPPVTKELADYCLKHKATLASWKQVERPTPLSVVVHTAEEGTNVPVYNGSSEMLMQSALMKTREIWQPLLATPAPLKSKFRSIVEDTPFLRTAVLSKTSRYSTETLDISRTFGVDRKRERNDVLDESNIAFKKSKLDEVPSASLKDQSVAATPLKTLSNKIIEVDETLLRTPYIKKRVTAPVSVTPQRITPQSILKSPWKSKRTSKGLTTPSKNTPVSFAKDNVTVNKLKEQELPAWYSPLPRQIRFSLPNDESDANDSVAAPQNGLDASEVTPRKRRRSARLEYLHNVRSSDETTVSELSDTFVTQTYPDNEKYQEIALDEDIHHDNINKKNEKLLEEGEVEEETDLQNEEYYNESSEKEVNGMESFDGRDCNIEKLSLSSKTSTLISINRDNILTITSSTDEFVSLPDDNNDSIVTTNKSDSINISSESNENLYDDIDDNEDILPYSLKFSEEDNVKDASNSIGENMEEICLETTDNRICNVSEVFTANNKSSINEFKTEELLDVNKEKIIDVEENLVSGEKLNTEEEEEEMKTYASLKTIDNYYQTESVDEKHDVEQEDFSSTNVEPDLDKKTDLSNKNWEHEYEKEYIEEYEPEMIRVVEDEENAAVDESDEDLYAGLDGDEEKEADQKEEEDYFDDDDDDVEDDYKNGKDVSGSSEVICIDSSDSEEPDSTVSNIKDKNRSKHYSEELDYDYDDDDDDDDEEEEEVYDDDDDDDNNDNEEDEEGYVEVEESGEEEVPHGKKIIEEEQEQYEEEEIGEREDEDDENNEEHSFVEEDLEENKEIVDRDVSLPELKTINGKYIEDQYENNRDKTTIKENKEVISNEEKISESEKKLGNKGVLSVNQETVYKETELESVEARNDLNEDAIKMEENEEKQVSNVQDVETPVKMTSSNSKTEILDVQEVFGLEDDKVDTHIDNSDVINKSEDQDMIKLHISSTVICDDICENDKSGTQLPVINEEPAEFENNEILLDITTKNEEIPLSSNETETKDAKESKLDIIPEEYNVGDCYEKLKFSPELTSITNRTRRRSKSADVLIPDIISKIRKSSSFSGNQLSNNDVIDLYSCEENKSKIDKDVHDDARNDHERTLKSLKNEEPSKITSVKSNDSHRLSRRSSSVSQLSEISSRCSTGNGTSFKRFSSTSSILLDVKKSQNMMYSLSSELDTSLGTFIKKLKMKKKSCKTSNLLTKPSTSKHYQPSLFRKTANKQVELIVDSSSEDDNKEKLPKTDNVKIHKKIKLKLEDTNNKPSTSKDGDDSIQKINEDHSIYNENDSHRKQELIQDQNIGYKTVNLNNGSIEKNHINIQENFEVKSKIENKDETYIAEENKDDVIYTEIQETDVNTEVVDSSIKNNTKEMEVEDSVDNKLVVVNIEVVDSSIKNNTKEMEVNDSVDNKLEVENGEEKNMDKDVTFEHENEDKTLSNQTTTDMSLRTTVKEIEEKTIIKQNDTFKIASPASRQVDEVKDNTVEEKLTNIEDLVIPIDPIIENKEDIPLISRNKTPDTFNYDKHKTRASSVVSDITPFTSTDHSRKNFLERQGKLSRRKSVSFYSINESKSTQSKRYSSRKSRQSIFCNLIKGGMDSYQRSSLAFDTHSTRASSVSSIDDNASTLSLTANSSKRSNRRFSRFMDRSSLKRSVKDNLVAPLEIVSSDDEDKTESVSYAETNVKGNLFLTNLTALNKRDIAKGNCEEKPSTSLFVPTASLEIEKKVDVIRDTTSVTNSNVSETEMKSRKSSVKRHGLRPRKTSEIIEELEETPKKAISESTNKSVATEEKSEKSTHSLSSDVEHSDPDISLKLVPENDLDDKESHDKSSKIKSKVLLKSINKESKSSKTSHTNEKDESHAEAEQSKPRVTESSDSTKKQSKSRNSAVVNEIEKDVSDAEHSKPRDSETLRLAKIVDEGKKSSVIDEKVKDESDTEQSKPRNLERSRSTKKLSKDKKSLSVYEKDLDESDTEQSKPTGLEISNFTKKLCKGKKSSIVDIKGKGESNTEQSKPTDLESSKSIKKIGKSRKSLVVNEKEKDESKSEQSKSKNPESLKSTKKQGEGKKSSNIEEKGVDVIQKKYKDRENDAPTTSVSEIETEQKLVKSKKFVKTKSSSKSNQMKNNESLDLDTIVEVEPEKLSEVKKSNKKKRTSKDTSKSSLLIVDSESDSESEIDSSLPRATSVPAWKKALRSSKLLDIPPLRQSKLKDMFNSLEIIQSDEGEEDDEIETPKKKTKQSPNDNEIEKSSKGKQSRKGSKKETEIKEGGTDSPLKRKKTRSVTNEKKRKKLSEIDNDVENTDYDKLSIHSEPVHLRSSKGSKRLKEEKKSIEDSEDKDKSTPKRNLRSSSIVTDSSVESKKSTRTVASEILPKRRSLFSTSKKRLDLDSSIIDEYTTQRRLTRNQKSLLERSLELSAISKRLHPKESTDNNSEDEDIDENTADTSISSIASNATVRSSPRLKHKSRRSQIQK
ncbi:AT hook containing transcription factor 1 homolog [Lycorma delicatula]|uniref:AT hook containing transcription factor 1 homolog n=1 Tax=Lycorma delicatula TaxID=130591 RepID=UPI003F51A10C